MLQPFKTLVRNTFIASALASLMLANPAAAGGSSEISEQSKILTVINLLTPAAGKQNEIVKLLQQGMINTMQYQPGFISANIHKSEDSDHVLVYAQWQSAAHLQAAVELIQGGEAPSMAKVFAVAQPDYHPYEVISVHRSHGEK